MEKYEIKCTSHTYISLFYGEKFLWCYDNDIEYMESIIERIEKRTGKKFRELKIIGSIDDFRGLRFLHGGFKNPFAE